MLKWAPLLYDRGIPWTSINGNHDHEQTDLDHEKQMGEFSRAILYLCGDIS